MMNQNQWWRRVEKVLLGALEQVDEPSRQAYLDLACAGDPELRKEVDVYVLADQAADQADFLERPVFSIPTIELGVLIDR